MLSEVIYLILLVSPVLSRHLPRYSDLDEDDQHLFRAAYETPSYDHDDYGQDYTHGQNDGKMDLMKDGLWALKAKIKELQAFDKSLAAHMLSTNIKVKDLLENHMGEILNHHHKKEKPSNNYHAPSYQQPQYPAQYGGQYAAPQYGHDPYYGH